MNYLEMKTIFSSYIYQDFLVFLVTKYITFFGGKCISNLLVLVKETREWFIICGKKERKKERRKKERKKEEKKRKKEEKKEESVY